MHQLWFTRQLLMLAFSSSNSSSTTSVLCDYIGLHNEIWAQELARIIDTNKVSGMYDRAIEGRHAGRRRGAWGKEEGTCGKEEGGMWERGVKMLLSPLCYRNSDTCKLWQWCAIWVLHSCNWHHSFLVFRIRKDIHHDGKPEPDRADSQTV